MYFRLAILVIAAAVAIAVGSMPAPVPLRVTVHPISCLPWVSPCGAPAKV
jgi:hypothetical protein